MAGSDRKQLASTHVRQNENDPDESEAYDLVGIVFEGNENLERILTPEGFEGFPHRKDFDISAEPVAFSFRDTPEGKPEALS